MKITRRFVSFATQALNPRRWLAAVKRKAVRIEAMAISLLLVPVILVMADHLPFIDVLNDTFYHDGVSAIYGARITTGTTPTTFSPEDFVTRGQMAVFLHRGLGRVAYRPSSSHVSLSGQLQDIAVLTINTGGASAGTGFLKVDAAFSAYSNTSACPCWVDFKLQADGGAVSQTHVITLYNASAAIYGYDSGAATLAFPVPSASPQTVRLKAVIGGSVGVVPPNTIWGFGEITALWVPFGATGGNTLDAAAASSGEAPQGTEPEAKPDTEK